MYNQLNRMMSGKPCFSNQFNVPGGFGGQIADREKATEQAEAYFDKAIEGHSRDELRDVYKALNDQNTFRVLISGYLTTLSAGDYQQTLTYNELQQIIHSVVQKRMMRFSFVIGFKKPELLFIPWAEKLSSMPSHKRAEFRTILESIRELGYIALENYAVYENKLTPLQKVCEIAEKLGLGEGLEDFEISGAVIHAYFKFCDIPVDLRTFTRPTLEESDVPVNGYNEIDVPVVHTQETRQAYLVEVLTKLNPASRFQVFKFVDRARFLTPEQFMDLSVTQIPTAQLLFPGQDVGVMHASMQEVCDAYARTYNEPFTMGHWLHLVVMIWAERERFYTLTDFVALVDKQPMDTSFTDIILKDVNDESIENEFNLSRLINTLEISQDVEVPGIELVHGTTSNAGRAGMTVASPKDLLENLARVRNNAIQKAIDEINGILDNEEYVRSIAAYDLEKGKVILELKLQSPLGGILADVMKAIEKAGWSVSSSVGDILCLEVSTTSYL